jgi:hypothetical protein
MASISMVFRSCFTTARPVQNDSQERYVQKPSSCSLKNIIFTIFTLGSLIPCAKATETCSLINPDPHFLDKYCDSFWDRCSIAVVPPLLSPVNALRALQLRLPDDLDIPTISYEEILSSNQKEDGRLNDLEVENGYLIDKTGTDAQVEEAWRTIGFGSECPQKDHYVEGYKNALIKTAFISFPLLNVSGFDREYGPGKAQEAITLYYSYVKKKFDSGDKTIRNMTEWKPFAEYYEHPHCFYYSRTPRDMLPFIELERFSDIQSLFSLINQFRES